MIKSHLYFALAWLALILGLIGIFLPVLPTTPFLLLAAFAFGKCSPRFHRWLSRNEYLGSYLENYRTGCGVPAKIIWRSLICLWGMLLFSAWYLSDYRFTLLFLLVGVGVSIHLLCLKRSAREAQRFTLIELLVSMGIIAVLASLLLPALNRARDLARNSVCLNHLRQIGIGLDLYVEDHTGYIPNISGQYMGSSIPVVRVKMGPQAVDFALGRLIRDYQLPPRIFGCPSNPSRLPAAIDEAWQGGSTVQTAYIYRETDVNFLPLKSSDSNSGKAMLMDFACLSGNGPSIIPHAFQSVSILFQDSHAASRKNSPAVGEYFTTYSNVSEHSSLAPPECEFIWQHADP